MVLQGKCRPQGPSDGLPGTKNCQSGEVRQQTAPIGGVRHATVRGEPGPQHEHALRLLLVRLGDWLQHLSQGASSFRSHTQGLENALNKHVHNMIYLYIVIIYIMYRNYTMYI